MKLYARTVGGTEADWEDLDKHLLNVGGRAGSLGAKFGAGEFALAAGLLHDLGKAKLEWQRYLRGKPRVIPHSAEGALAAVTHYARSSGMQAQVGRLLAFTIAGHHSGLSNGNLHGGGVSPLNDRMESAETLEPWLALPILDKPPQPLRSAGKDPLAWAFFIRMLFSTLVDADRLVSEEVDNHASGRPTLRSTVIGLSDIKVRFDASMAKIFGGRSDASELATLRAEVLADCRAAASARPGLFSLTVPTGGGKTLSSLAFALDHAAHHAQRFDRIIYVIPFTSIIDQTADVFRGVLNEFDAILEHHSAFDDEKLDRRLAKENEYGKERLRLAAQNWDRPVVVTTAVQFFESLFANSAKSCRKLHNISRSIIVLDEAQTLPVKLLRPCVAVLKELVRGYGCSVVLCTATQPALTKEAFKSAAPVSHPPSEMLDEASVREIIRPNRRLYARLKRVRSETAGTMSDDALIRGIGATTQGLIIVNNRRHARELFDAMTKASVDGARHLTTGMTAAHRQHALSQIRDDLKQKRPVRLVSTSLIEAGVDISFEAVWRASAGLDQIVQAAGRCNRNGEYGPLGGRLTIFSPEEQEGRKSPPELERNAEATAIVLARGFDPLSPEAVQEYFSELLWTHDDEGRWTALDAVEVGELRQLGIMKSLKDDSQGLNFAFADIAAAFRFIQETMVPLIIPASIDPIAGADDAILDSIPNVKGIGGVLRDLQRHIVQVPRRARDEIVRAGSAAPIAPDIYAEQFVRLVNRDLYSTAVGLNWDDPTYRGALFA